MRYVELVPGVRSSVLGFGCSTLLGSIGGHSAQAALGAARDVGINHFDLARSYEAGMAEKLVGQLFRSQRSEVTLVTKFGLQPRLWAHLFQPVKPVVRSWRGAGQPGPAGAGGAPSSSASAGFDRWAKWQYRRLPMTARSMRSSLEASLRAIRTDYVDVLLMHEPPVVERWDELLACANDLKAAGKIRGWGLATSALAPELSHSDLDVLQTSPSQAEIYCSRLQQMSASTKLVLFSALRGAAANAVPDRLSRLWQAFPEAVVVCTMRNPEHIRQNAATAVGSNPPCPTGETRNRNG